MLILGKSLPYLQNAISSGLDSVNQGIVHTTQQQGIQALDKAINLFLPSETNAQGFFETQKQPPQVSAPADFPDPTSFLGNQQGTGEVLTFLHDSTFRAGSELNNFSKNLSHHFAQIQSQVTREQAASLNTMQNTLGRMNSLQQNLDAQLYSSRLAGASFGLLQNSNMQKASDLMSPELTFTPADPAIDNQLVAAKPHRLFVRDGSDVNEVDMNDVGLGRTGNTHLMTWIAAVARQDPKRIKNMIRENNDGTYTVMFKQRISNEPLRYKDWPVKVSADFEGGPVDPKKEIWPLLIEKAYEQMRSDKSAFGIGNLGLESLTGRPETIEQTYLTQIEQTFGSSEYPAYTKNFEQMKNDFDSGKAIILAPGRSDVDYVLPKFGKPSPDIATVSSMYSDPAGNNWVELYYPGFPDGPRRVTIPFDQLPKIITTS